jgi:hypothetical protein
MGAAVTDIFIPTLRINRISDIVKNISNTTFAPYRIYFIVEKPDFELLNGSSRREILLNHRSATYAGAINSAFEQTDGETFFCGADDLQFYPHWLETALEYIDEYGVVGTNDKLNIHVKAKEHATHYLVSRDYIKKYGGTADKTFPVLYEYLHNYCDTEFIQTAIKRHEFKPCLESIVKHEHWTKDKSKMDSIYRKSHKTKNIDLETFNSRKHLWK